jgi:hypothetical protein
MESKHYCAARSDDEGEPFGVYGGCRQLEEWRRRDFGLFARRRRCRPAQQHLLLSYSSCLRKLKSGRAERRTERAGSEEGTSRISTRRFASTPARDASAPLRCRMPSPPNELSQRWSSRRFDSTPSRDASAPLRCRPRESYTSPPWRARARTRKPFEIPCRSLSLSPRAPHAPRPTAVPNTRISTTCNSE